MRASDGVLLVATAKQRKGRAVRNRWQIALPSAATERIWSLLHEAAAHDRGLTLNRLTRLFTRPGLYHAGRRLCDACVVCQRTSAAAGLNALGSHSQSPIAPTRPGQTIYCDVFSALDTMWLTVLDLYTHYLSAYPIENKQSTTVARVLMQHGSLFGPAEQLATDAGSEVEGAVGEFATRTNIEHTQALPEVHTGIGALERGHRSINDRLRKALAQWETHNPVGTLPVVDVVLHAVTTINAHPRAPNDVSAYELLFGRPPTLPPAVHLYPSLLEGLAVAADPEIRQYCALC
jgi:hypothetical protein